MDNNGTIIASKMIDGHLYVDADAYTELSAETEALRSLYDDLKVKHNELRAEYLALRSEQNDT